MSSKKNLPHIPLYIGDWQKDCDVLSLEAEGAWLRIIFKMFTNGKQSVYKIPTKSLQNLWKCGPEKMNEIIDELEFNNICGINRNERFVEFTSRRFIRENNLSEVRKEAVSKRKDRSNSLQKSNKSSTNKVQITDNDIDNDIDTNNENKKKGGDQKLTFSELGNVRMTESEFEKLKTEHGASAADWMINKLSNYKSSTGRKYKSDYRAILSWVVSDYIKNGGKTFPKEPNGLNRALKRLA